ncbi:MAG: class I SAM-dependent methyltransferase [Anaerolineae bacterium]|nr:class I SAM-dependent methyltransferase [Anaerolineae bacterium]
MSDDKLMLLGYLCGMQPGVRMLDLACGKGEMLSRWAQTFGITGVGVDTSATFLETAQQRASELGVAEQVQFVRADGSDFIKPDDEYYHFDVVSCLGASWVGGGLVGILELMKMGLRNENSLILVGEPYWIDLPPVDAYQELGVGTEEFVTLEGTLDRFDLCGLELIEMVLSDTETWDRYAAGQWMAVSNWLRENPHDNDAPALAQWIAQDKRAYMRYSRRYFGWGVFVLRQMV